MDYASFLTGVYQDQLGRAPDSAGMAFYLDALQSGALSQNDVLGQINQSVEGQAFDKQAITSAYRESLGRNPDVDGMQYYLSAAQTDPGFTASILNQAVRAGVTGSDVVGNYTNFVGPSVQADPYAGFLAGYDIWSPPADAANISYVDGRPIAFATPVNLAPRISTYDRGEFVSKAGADVLSPENVDAAVRLAVSTGAMSQQDYATLFNDLAAATNISEVRAALNKPQANVVVDALYGIQIGEDATLARAQEEAVARGAALPDLGYYPGMSEVDAALIAAGLPAPFRGMPGSSPVTQRSMVTPDTFANLLSDTINRMYATSDFMPSPTTGGFYSERGFEPSFVPFGTVSEEGVPEPQFRSGVFGYTGQMPTGFQFGVPPAPEGQGGTSFFTPGQFNPNASSYDAMGRALNEAGMPIEGGTGGSPTFADLSKFPGITIQNGMFANPMGQLFTTPEMAFRSIPVDSGGG
jgi:hypothetical protein